MEEGSQSKLSRFRGLTQNHFNPDENIDSLVNQMDLLQESKMGLNRVEPRSSSRKGNSSAELSLSYLMGTKGKEVAVPDDSDKWVERDFLNLGPKRELEEHETEREVNDREKRQKPERLNLSLAPPEASPAAEASNSIQNARDSLSLAPVPAPAPAPSTSNNTRTTCSNDFTAPSISYSYSLPFSHNPSCSLTRNSTENYDDPVWHAGEGTNGSVHSRFKPVGDGSVALSNNPSGGGTSNFLSLYKANNTSDSNSCFLPSELPACPRKDTVSGDSRGRRIPGPERLVREIVSISIPIMAKTVQELPNGAIELAKDYLKNLIAERRGELAVLQSRLDRRSDLSKESLAKCHTDQLDMLLAARTGLGSFISPTNRLPTPELIEIFLFMRCRNVMCKSLLPVDDCECKICSANKGFCSSCMCPICLNFDCAQNTCSWVGCDVCSHWCHASCGIQRNLIRPGQSLKGPIGATEMQFHCIGCNHTSEMLGFVKDVFTCCAKDWGLETLAKELDCARKIFRSSKDFKGKQVYLKAEEMLYKLQDKSISPSEACIVIVQFFNGIESMAELPTISSTSSKEATLRFNPSSFTHQEIAALLQPSSFMRSLTDFMGVDLHKKTLQASSLPSIELKTEEDLKVDMSDNLESIIRIKEVEMRMFQNKADEARREAEAYKEMVCMKTEKMEEEYAQRIAKLCLRETEDRRRKKLEELKGLENSHCDYQNMKLRMQDEIAGLLQRMETTKQQLV